MHAYEHGCLSPHSGSHVQLDRLYAPAVASSPMPELSAALLAVRQRLGKLFAERVQHHFIAEGDVLALAMRVVAAASGVGVRPARL